MSNDDSASVTFKVTLTPAVVKEYFEGLAKVEEAKRSNQSNDWACVSQFLPLIVPILSNVAKSYVSGGMKCPVRMPVLRSVEQDQECEDSLDSESTDSKQDIVITLMKKPSATDSEPSESIAPCKEIVTSEQVKKESSDKTELQEDNSDKKSESVSAAKPKRPMYQDGENVVVDISGFTNAFSGGNGGGFSDMMKMFGPIMEGMMGGMAAQKPDDSSKPKESSTTTPTTSPTDEKKSSETKEEKPFFE